MKRRRGVLYRCPVCGISITVMVTPSFPPTCSKHVGGGKIMVAVDPEDRDD